MYVDDFLTLSFSVVASLLSTSTTGGPMVYDATPYLDDHPGGAEVMLDVAGQDADEFFEDIGHSQDARDELKKHLIGSLKLDAAAIAKMKADAEAKAKGGSGGAPLGVILVVLVAAAAIGYQFLQSQQAPVVAEA